MEKEFEPVFERFDFINLSNYACYVKMTIDGKPSPAFSARTLLYHQLHMQKSNPPTSHRYGR